MQDIVINSNGLHNEKLAYLVEHKLIQGVYMDIKYPVWLEGNEEVFNKVLGVNYNEYISLDINKSIILVKSFAEDLKYVQFRTVKYDFLPPAYFECIEREMKEAKEEYGIEHVFNPFVNL